MACLKGAAVVGQSGGPTAAINATLAGVIEGALGEDRITRLFGMKNGIEGFMRGDLTDLGEAFTFSDGSLDREKLDILCQTPAASLGSCRKKLPSVSEDAEFYKQLTELFIKNDIRYFFYIGGNDSMDTVAKLTEYLKLCDWEMRVIGVPKTIDNDLEGTDHTPGYGSAAKFIAATVSEIIRDCAVYTVNAVTIVEIMGRDAGWLTAASGLPKLMGRPAPDLIYLPEVAFSYDRFLNDVKNALEKHPNVVVAVSEGIRDAEGRYAGEGAQSGAADVFGHKYLAGTGKALAAFIKEQLGCKVRSVELNLPQRCAAHLQSDTDIRESLSVGSYAVTAALRGDSGCMISIERGEGYSISYTAKNISDIANAVRSVPRDMINKEGNYVTDECLQYILPLIQGEREQKYEMGLPVHIIL